MEWIRSNTELLWWLGIGSGVMFLATLLIVPWLVIRLPEDYFVREDRKPIEWFGAHPAARIALLVVKNALGLVLLLAGIAMILLPGQGIITILLGLSLMNFPGKFALERRIVRQKPVLRAINWMRRRAGRPPIIPPAIASAKA